MRALEISPQNTVFIILSFEGPDRYSMAGGLGVRVTNLSHTLASMGFLTHLIFVGDPRREGEEVSGGGSLVLNRWCQWISEYYPNGVYHGENEKLYDFNRSIPMFIAEHIVKPAAAQDKLVVILGEEWHTAEAMCRTSDLLHSIGLRDRTVMFWNANNTFGFDRIDWKRLAYTTTITTVSRYMKHVLWEIGVNPLVIPNGIPRSLLNGVDRKVSARLRRGLNTDLLLAKVARWDPDKRWIMAVEATARLKARGRRTVLLARGGTERHGFEVMNHARSLGLAIKDATAAGEALEDHLDAIRDGVGTDILNVRFHCSQELLRIVYNASDAVLANSGREPFGLVGLETMAAGGIPFVGATGEDYAIPWHNCIALETSDPKEIEDYVLYLDEHPAVRNRIRKGAKNTAKLFTWEEIVKNLIQKLEYQAGIQGFLAIGPRDMSPHPKLLVPSTAAPSCDAVLAGTAQVLYNTDGQSALGGAPTQVR